MFNFSHSFSCHKTFYFTIFGRQRFRLGLTIENYYSIVLFGAFNYAHRFRMTLWKKAPWWAINIIDNRYSKKNQGARS